MSKYTITGAILGALLALSGLQFGFGGFLFVLVLMVVGAVVGRILEGSIDVKGIVDAIRGNRSAK